MIAIANNFHPNTGIGKYAFNLLHGLTDENKDVEMLYYESKDNHINEMRAVRKVQQKVGFPVANRTLSSYLVFPKNVPSGYELYHASSQYLARITKFRRPCVITHHDIAPLLFPSEYPFVLRHFVKKMIACYKNADMIIAISDSSKRDLLKYIKLPEENVKVVLHGIDNKLYRPMKKADCKKKLGLPIDKKIVLHVGSEEKRKNLPLLFKLMRKKKKKIGDVVLLVRVGNRDPTYEKMRNGINIKYFSGIPEEEMPLFYNSADAFVFPSIYEGFGLPVAESMACGVPTIVSKHLDAFKDGAVILGSDDDKELTDVLLEILTTPSKVKLLSKRSLQASKKFTLKNEAEQTWKIYQDLL